jgi:hypothetical protein
MGDNPIVHSCHGFAPLRPFGESRYDTRLTILKAASSVRLASRRKARSAHLPVNRCHGAQR